MKGLRGMKGKRIADCGLRIVERWGGFQVYGLRFAVGGMKVRVLSFGLRVGELRRKFLVFGLRFVVGDKGLE